MTYTKSVQAGILGLSLAPVIGGMFSSVRRIVDLVADPGHIRHYCILLLLAGDTLWSRGFHIWGFFLHLVLFP